MFYVIYYYINNHLNIFQYFSVWEQQLQVGMKFMMTLGEG
jgi:hypothetical protein